MLIRTIFLPSKLLLPDQFLHQNVLNIFQRVEVQIIKLYILHAKGCTIVSFNVSCYSASVQGMLVYIIVNQWDSVL